MLGQAREYARNLRGRLSFSENDFRHAVSQRTMMVHLGEAEVFKRQMTQPVHGVVRREFALAYLLEEFANGFGVHAARRSQHSADANTSLASGNLTRAPRG